MIDLSGFVTIPHTGLYRRPGRGRDPGRRMTTVNLLQRGGDLMRTRDLTHGQYGLGSDPGIEGQSLLGFKMMMKVILFINQEIYSREGMRLKVTWERGLLAKW